MVAQALQADSLSLRLRFSAMATCFQGMMTSHGSDGLCSEPLPSRRRCAGLAASREARCRSGPVCSGSPRERRPVQLGGGRWHRHGPVAAEVTQRWHALCNPCGPGYTRNTSAVSQGKGCLGSGKGVGFHRLADPGSRLSPTTALVRALQKAQANVDHRAVRDGLIVGCCG